MRLKQYITESQKRKVYHGDNYNTRKLDPKLMNQGNNQEGVGIYFADDINTAMDYGKNIIAIEIDPTKFINSRSPIAKLNQNSIFKMLKEFYKIDEEEFYYYITDMGIEVFEPEDITEAHIKELSKYIKSEQIRNWQVDMASKFGTENFVDLWNKHLPYDGTKFQNREDDTWYAVINTNLKVSKYNK